MGFSPFFLASARAFLAARRSRRSSSFSNAAKSSIGTMAATFFPFRRTTMRSRLLATRLRLFARDSPSLPAQSAVEGGAAEEFDLLALLLAIWCSFAYDPLPIRFAQGGSHL